MTSTTIAPIRATAQLNPIPLSSAETIDSTPIPSTDQAGPKRMVPLAEIDVDPALQIRAAMDKGTVAEYAESYRLERSMPALIVFRVPESSKFLLVDGNHRLQGAQEAGLLEIEVEVRQGTKKDALFFAVGANTCHGLPRSNADKNRAVMVLLTDQEWSGMSNAAIAEHVGVSHTMVNNLRKECETTGNGFRLQPLRRTSNGKLMKVVTANRHPKPLTRRSTPDPSLSTESRTDVADPKAPHTAVSTAPLSSVPTPDPVNPDPVCEQPIPVECSDRLKAGSNSDPATLRSAVIQMLAEGIRACEFDEVMLDKMDDAMLADYAHDQLSAQAAGHQGPASSMTPTMSSNVRSKDMAPATEGEQSHQASQISTETLEPRLAPSESEVAKVSSRSTNEKQSKQFYQTQAEEIREELIAFCPNAPIPIWCKVSSLSQVSLDRYNQTQLQEFIASAQELLTPPSEITVRQ